MSDNLNRNGAETKLERLFASELAVFPLHGVTVITFSSPDDMFVVFRKALAHVALERGLLRFGRTKQNAVIMGERPIRATFHWFAPSTLGYRPDRFIEVKRSLRNRRTHAGRRVTQGTLPVSLPHAERQKVRAFVLCDMNEMFDGDEPGNAGRGFSLWVVEPGVHPVVATQLKECVTDAFSPWPADQGRRHVVRQITPRLVLSTMRYVVAEEDRAKPGSIIAEAI